MARASTTRGQRLLLEVGLALDGGHQVGHQVGAALVLVEHLGPGRLASARPAAGSRCSRSRTGRSAAARTTSQRFIVISLAKGADGSIDGMSDAPFQALQGALRAQPAAAPRGGRLVIAGATGALGNEVLRRLVGLRQFAATQVLAREPITAGLRGVRHHARALRRSRRLATRRGRHRRGAVRSAAPVLRPRARAVDAAARSSCRRWRSGCGAAA